MRWALTKRLWKLCKNALPQKSLWLSVPFTLGKSGEIKVYEQGTNAEIGKVKYQVSSKYGKTTIVASINGLYDEVAFKRRLPITVKASKEEWDSQAGLKKEAVSTMEPPLAVNDRVRIDNPVSMEHNELGTIMGIRGDHMNGWYYAVLVDGSSKPIWVPKETLKPNKAGLPPDEQA